MRLRLVTPMFEDRHSVQLGNPYSKRRDTMRSKILAILSACIVTLGFTIFPAGNAYAVGNYIQHSNSVTCSTGGPRLHLLVSYYTQTTTSKNPDGRTYSISWEIWVDQGGGNRYQTAQMRGKLVTDPDPAPLHTNTSPNNVYAPSNGVHRGGSSRALWAAYRDGTHTTIWGMCSTMAISGSGDTSGDGALITWDTYTQLWAVSTF